jgi:CubicO group peptidase (beta-lactamase class C family)
MNKILFVFAFFALIFSCNEPASSEAAGTPANDSTAGSSEPGIVSASPASVGMDSTLLDSMTAAIVRNEYPNIHSVLVAKDGKLVYENYFPGTDEIRGTPLGRINHGKDSLHDLRSISKSVTSACVGIAIAQGKIKSEDQSVWDFFPEYVSLKNKQNEGLSIKHLLTMSSGLDWNENIPYTNPANSEIQMDNSEDPIKYVLSRKIVSAPGSKWNYNGGATEVLATIITKATGMNVEEFARTFLFKPLGIEKYYWVKFDSTVASRNVPAAASGLRLRPRDILKFGLLYMNEGMFNGKQVLPASWVSNSHKAQILRGGDSTQAYGYQFWISENKIGGKQFYIPAANGNGDQRLYFDKTNNLLVAVTAGNYNKWDIKNGSWQLVENFIYPSFIH